MATPRELWCDVTAPSCRWIVGFVPSQLCCIEQGRDGRSEVRDRVSTHRCDPTTKRARFAPISSHPHNQYTPPSSPFLSRSASEMNNPSPYDSGFDSSFFTASGPGQPPSSRGNSDIDDQVDRYIRDQRVATLINTPTDSSHSANPVLSQNH